MKYNLGAGAKILPGYNNLDKPDMDLELPFPINSGIVDEVLLEDVIEHIRNHRQCLSEIYRILKPGGRLVLRTPNYRALGKRLRLLAGQAGFLDDLDHVRLFTDKTIAREVRLAGFRDLEFASASPFARLLPYSLQGNVIIIARKEKYYAKAENVLREMQSNKHP